MLRPARHVQSAWTRVFLVAVGVCVGLLLAELPRVRRTTRLMPMVQPPGFCSTPGWLPGPQPADVTIVNDPACVTPKQGAVEFGFPPRPFKRASKPAHWCSDRAGQGYFDRAKDRWVWTHAEECGFEWLSPEQACALLQGWTVVFMGDSTSRRLAFSLKALLAGLPAAADASLRTDDAQLPDLFGRFTDGTQWCLPASQCPCVQVAGVAKPAAGWGTTVAAFENDAGEEEEGQHVIWRPFFTPLVTQTAGMIKVWAAQVGDFVAGVDAGQSLIEQAEAMTTQHKTLVVANVGAWHLQGPRPFVVRKGQKDPFNTAGAGRFKPLAEDKSYLREDVFLGRMQRAFASAKHGPRHLWVWRTTAAVNESSERFVNDAGVNDVVREWDWLTAQAAAQAGWVVADVFGMSLGRSNGDAASATATWRPRVDGMGHIHLRDVGRRTMLQICLNAAKAHLLASEADAKGRSRTWPFPSAPS